MIGGPESARFQLIRQLGVGGTGVVYEALDRERGTRVALKTLIRIDAQAIYRLKREFRALQGIAHPNLVVLGDLVEEGGSWFLTMELVHGSDVLSWVRRPGAGPPGFDEARLRSALRQLAEGLGALHAAGKVHRDIKPSNIRVTPEGRVVLLDFGLVVEAEPGLQSMDGSIAGTFEYMAPEQAGSSPIGPAADWYGVGVVLYQALTGELPFGGSMLEVLVEKNGRDPAPPRAREPAVPADLDQLCMDLLARTPATRPDARELLRRLGAESAGGATATPSQHTFTPAFVGREPELEALRRAWESSRDLRTVVVHLEGEPGVGKTALVRELAARLAIDEPALVVLGGRCYQRESVPYKGIDGVIDSLSRHLRHVPEGEVAAVLPRHVALLRRVFPALARVEVVAEAPEPRSQPTDPQELRGRLYRAVRELLTRLAERNPVLVVIDDLQWSDGDSQAMLRELLREPDAPPAMFVLAARSDLGPWRQIGGDALSMRIGRLPAGPARELAGALLARHGAAADREQVDSIVDEAGGHPLLIEELARLIAQGSVAGPPPRLDDAIRRRVAQLDAGARLVLELLAVAGEPIETEIAAAAARIADPRSFSTHVAVLRVASLARLDPAGRLEPYHHQVREAVLAVLGEEARAEHHRRLGVALEAAGAGAHPELLVRHWVGAGERERAARTAAEAGRRAAAALAFDRAADLYRDALALGDHDETAARGLRLDLGHALSAAGRGAEAADAYLLVAEGAEPEFRRDCRRLAVEQLLATGHIHRAVATLGESLAEAGVPVPRSPGRALARALWQRTRLRLRGLRWTERPVREGDAVVAARIDLLSVASSGFAVVDTVRGFAFHNLRLRQALDLGEPARVAEALLYESIFAAAQGERDRAARLATQGEAAAARVSSPRIAVLADTSKGMRDYMTGAFHDAAPRLLAAERSYAERAPDRTIERNAVRLFHLIALRHSGAFTAWRAGAEIAIGDAVRRGDLYAEVSVSRTATMLWLAADDIERAERVLERLAWPHGADDFHVQDWYELEARGELALYQGRAADALAELAGRFSGLERSLLPRLEVVRCMATWVRGRLVLAVAGATRDPQARRRGLREALRWSRRLQREIPSYAQVQGLMLAAGVANLRGDGDGAVFALRRALALAERDRLTMHAAFCQHRLAGLLGGDEGAACAAAADAWIGGEGIADPERFGEVVAPGFPAP